MWVHLPRQEAGSNGEDTGQDLECVGSFPDSVPVSLSPSANIFFMPLSGSKSTRTDAYPGLYSFCDPVSFLLIATRILERYRRR